MILIVAGILLAAVVVIRPVASLKDVSGALWTPIRSTDPANPSVLSPASQPYNRTFWGYGPMPVGGSLALNILTSGPVRVLVVSMMQDQTGDIVFNEVGTSFFESVPASGGTYHVEIKNEGDSPVQIMNGSNVIGQQSVTTHEIAYPYMSWGSLVAALGVMLVIVGLVAKPKRRLTKR